MSLRHHVVDPSSPVRSFIDEHFEFQPLSRETNRLMKMLPMANRPYEAQYDYTVAGTAVDLVIRGLFDQAIHLNLAVRSGLGTLGGNGCYFFTAKGEQQVSTWSSGKEFWDTTPGPPPKTEAVINAFVEFSTKHDFKLLDDVDATRLATFCILFARIDHARRNFSYAHLMPLGPLSVDEKLKMASTTVMTDDLVRLFRGFAARHPDAISRAGCVATGRILAGSNDVQGADFDFVIDGCLYEIKTTIKPSISVEMMRQCVGYWLLDYDDEFAIREIALDLPRQGFVRRLDVRGDLLRPAFRDVASGDIRRAFRKRLIPTS